MKNKVSRPGRFAAATLAASFLLAGCFEQSASQLVQSGKARMEKKEYKAAVIDFKNALQKDGSLTEGRFLLGKALLEAGDPTGALVEFRKLQENGYDNEVLAPMIAASLVFKGDFDRFLAEYADVDLKTPARQAELKAAVAAAYGARGKYVQARTATDAALQADPHNVAAQMALVQLLLISDDKKGALEQAERSVKEHPDSDQAWITKAQVQQAIGAPLEQTIASYSQALKLNKTSMQAHIGIIELLLRQRDFDGVRKQLAEAGKLQANHPLLMYYAGLAAFEQNDLKQAQDLALQLLKLAPNNARFLQFAGMVEYERGRYIEAAAHLGKALTTTQSPAAVRALLARAQLRAGDPRKALSTVQPLLDGATKQPAEVYSAAAEALVQLGDAEGAKRMFALAVKANPRDERGRTALALAQIQDGRDEQGLKELKAIASSEEGAVADVAMIGAYLRGNRLSEAEAAVADLEKKTPNKPVTAFYKARIAQLRGQDAQAREQFELALKRQPTYMPAASALAAMDMQAQKPQDAIARFEKVIAADPAQMEARLGTLLIRKRMGVPNSTLIEQLDGIIKQFPDSDAAQLAKINLLLEERDNKAAVAAAFAGASRFPDKPLFLDYLGQAEMAQGHHALALQAFSKMAAMDPNAIKPMMRIAEAHMSRSDAPAAVSQLRKVLGVKPDFAPAQSMLVALLARTGKPDEAMTVIRSVQTRTPDEPRGWTFEGDLLMAKGNPAAAATAFRTSLKKRESSDAAVKLHQSLVMAGQAGEAAKLEDDWVKRHPDDALFLFHLADVALSNSNFDRSEALYRKVTMLAPENAIAWNNLAWLLMRQSKPGALAMGEKALSLMPDSTAILDTLAEINAKEGRLDQALTLQKRALELEPQQHVHRLHLAQYLVKANQKAAARVELQKLSELGKGFAKQDEVEKLLGTL